MKGGLIVAIVGTVIVVGVGAVVFLSSQKAKAAELAAEGFTIADDCSTIEVVDEAKAEASIRAAAISIFPSMDDDAVEFFDACLVRMFPQCTDHLDEMSIVQRGPAGSYAEIPLGHIRLFYLHGKTVGDIKAMLEAGELVTSAGSPTPESIRDTIVRAAIGGV